MTLQVNLHLLQLLKNLMTKLSFLKRHFTGKPAVTSDVSCFLRLKKSQLHNILVRKISVFRVNIKAGKVTEERQGTPPQNIFGRCTLTELTIQKGWTVFLI